MDEQLTQHFDRIKAALDAQERKRRDPDFTTWCERALPHFLEHVIAVREAEQLAPGQVLLTWHDWMALRGYARRGRPLWVPTGRGPLYFTPPNLEQLAERFAFECRQRGIALPRRPTNGEAPVERRSGRDRLRGGPGSAAGGAQLELRAKRRRTHAAVR